MATQIDERNSTNEHIHRALNRLLDMLKSNPNGTKSAPHLSHYRELTVDVKTAYDLLNQGASLVSTHADFTYCRIFCTRRMDSSSTTLVSKQCIRLLFSGACNVDKVHFGRKDFNR